MRKTPLWLLILALLGVVGCATNAHPADTEHREEIIPEAALSELIELDTASQSVDVVLDEWQVGVEDTGPLAGGGVTFLVRNDGLIPHALSVFATGADSKEVRVVYGRATVPPTTPTARTPELAPGGQHELTLLLPAGQYLLLCNLPAHYEAGMRTEFTVR